MGLRLGVCFLLCVYFFEIKGSSSQPRFIQTNRDLRLTVTEEVQIGLYSFFWKFNNSNNIISLNGDIVNRFDYQNRVEFFKQNLSLILKNVQLSDSGIYTAIVSKSRDEILSTHDVRVQDPVSPVLLSVDSVFNTSESCNFTVSCTAELSPSISISRSFTCDRHTCKEASPAPYNPTPSLQLNLSDVSIICNHSNHISWRNDTKDIQQVCPLFGAEGSAVKSTADIGAIVVGTVLLLCFLGLIGGGVVLWKKRKNKRFSMENTVYEAPQMLPSRPAGRDIVPTESPTSIYSEVQPHTGPGPAPAPAQNPESLYATVNKPSHPTPDLLSSA